MQAAQLLLAFLLMGAGGLFAAQEPAQNLQAKQALLNANQDSRLAVGQNSEGSRSYAQQAFGAGGRGGGVADGVGLSAADGAAGPAAAADNTTFGGGNPIAGGGTAMAGVQVPAAPPGRPAAPWHRLVALAVKLMAAAGLALLLAGILVWIGKHATVAGHAFILAGMALASAAAALGGMVVALGMMLAFKYGQTLQGILFAGIAGFLTYHAVRAVQEDRQAYLHYQKSTQGFLKSLGQQLKQMFTGKPGGLEGKLADKAQNVVGKTAADMGLDAYNAYNNVVDPLSGAWNQVSTLGKGSGAIQGPSAAGNAENLGQDAAGTFGG